MKGHDQDLRSALGITRLCGIDEAGRGPLAGPVTAAAVILPAANVPLELNDSKKLSSKKRQRLEHWILNHALSYAIVHISHTEVDKINILQATFCAMRAALKQLNLEPEYTLVDGRDFPLAVLKGQALIKGDTISASIAAASILAKEARDRWMCEAAQKYPDYGFDSHKGYGTAAHRRALIEHGPCDIHRRSFAPVRELL